MLRKIMVSLLSISLAIVIMLIPLNPCIAAATLELTGIKTNAIDKLQAEAVGMLKSGLCNIAVKMGKCSKADYSSKDGVVAINVSKDERNIIVNVSGNGNDLPDDDYRNIGKTTNIINNYLKSAFNEKQTMALCSLLIGEAYAQYIKGKTNIYIIKEYEGLTIECSGDIKSGMVKVKLQGVLGVEKCQQNKSRIMVTKV